MREHPILGILLTRLGFRCRHILTWPRRRRTSDGRRGGNYQCCVQCGQEFVYRGELANN